MILIKGHWNSSKDASFLVYGCCSLYEPSIFMSLGNNPKQTHSKDGIQVQSMRHPSSNQWTMTTSRRSTRTSNVRVQILICMLSNLVHVCIFQSSVHIHPCNPNLERNYVFTICPNLITLTLRLLDFVKFDWNEITFVLKTSLWSWFLHASGKSKQMLIKSSRHQRVVWKFQIHWNAPWGNKGLIDKTHQLNSWSLPRSGM